MSLGINKLRVGGKNIGMGNGWKTIQEFTSAKAVWLDHG